MNSSYRQIIYKILNEEKKVGENNLTRILEWYETWNNKVTNLIVEGEYDKVIGVQFKVGMGLLNAMKVYLKTQKNTDIKEKFETLKNKLIVINNSRKLIDTLK